MQKLASCDATSRADTPEQKAVRRLTGGLLGEVLGTTGALQKKCARGRKSKPL